MTITTEEGNRRLLVLAEFLEKLPEKRFNYEYWVGPNWDGTDLVNCKTTACALGWCAAIPEFKALGVEVYRASEHDFGVKMGESSGSTWKDSWSTGGRLFALSEMEFGDLFIAGGDSPPGNATASEVAAHIRRFVASRS
jgi:hypothetical protein